MFAAAADFAQHEQIVIGLVHAQAEAGGHLGPFLPDPWQRVVEQFRGVGKAERGRIEGEAEFGGSQFQDRHGWVGVLRMDLARVYRI